MPYPMMHLMLFTWRHSASTTQFVQKRFKAVFALCNWNDIDWDRAGISKHGGFGGNTQRYFTHNLTGIC